VLRKQYKIRVQGGGVSCPAPLESFADVATKYGAGKMLMKRLTEVRGLSLHSRMDRTGCHHLASVTIRPTRVALTPGGCQIGYVDHIPAVIN
jgi:hypothetical protein